MLSTLSALPESLQTTLDDPHMLHAAVVHLPAALAVFGIPIVLAALVLNTRSVYARAMGVACYLLLAVTAYIAVQTGETASEQLPNTLPAELWEGVTRHEELAEKVAWFALVTAGLMALSFLRNRVAGLSALGLAVVSGLATLVWVVQTGHQGGSLVYRDGIGAPALVIETRRTDGASEVAPEVLTAAAVLEEPLPTPIRYSDHVEPIFRDYCVACHNTKDAEGGLDLTDSSQIAIGGEKQGPAALPGFPQSSPIIGFVKGALNPRMPKDELPLGDREIQILEQWIREGARVDNVAPSESGVAIAAPSRAGGSLLMQFIARRVGEEHGELRRLDPDEARQVRYAFLSEEGVPAEGTERVDSFHLYERHALRRLRRELRLTLVDHPAGPPSADGLDHPVDQFVASRLTDAGLSYPDTVCTDAAFLRRAYLDLLGVVPTVEEIQAFAARSDVNKRSRLIDELLTRDAPYAENWVPFWEDALCSTQGSIPEQELVDRELDERGDYERWIYDAFEANMPYDLWVTELLDPAMPAHPEHYVLRTERMDIISSASNTAQVFMGTAMKCASCHNHFSNSEWTQNRFLGFAGFFADTDLELVRCDRYTNTFVPTSFIFDLPQMNSVIPKSQDQRIARLAELLIDPTNPRFARTLVNRIWRRLIGEGLSEPVDDYRASRPPSHPALLEWLAYDFMINGYDIKHVLRRVMTSRTYQLPYDAALVETFDVGNAEAPRYFRSPHLRRLSAEQVVDSVRRALGGSWDGEARLYRNDDVTPFRKALGRTTTRNEVMTSRPDDLAVVQGLEFLNSPEYHAYIYESPHVQALAPTLLREGVTPAFIEDIYLRALSRRPSEAETVVMSAYLDEAIGGRRPRPGQAIAPRLVERSAQAIGDVFWVLFSGAEFQYIS